MKLKRIAAPYDKPTHGCKGCAGVTTEILCLAIDEMATEQGLRGCGMRDGINYIYVEDKENDIK